MKLKFKINDAIFLAVFILLPLVFNPFNGEVEIVKLGFLVFLAILLGFWPGKFKWNYSLAVLIIFGAIATVFAEDKYLAFWGSSERHFGFAAMLAGIVIAAKLPKINFEKFFILSGAISSAAAIVITNISSASLFEGRMGGTTGNPNILGAFLVPTIFLTIANFKTRAVSSWAALILQIYVLFETGNRSSWLALAIILLIFCTQKKNWRMLATTVFSAGIFAFFGWDRLITEVSIGTRFELYKLALKEILSHPFGVGYEHIQTVISSPTFNLVPDRVHQPFLDMSLSAGIPSALALLALSITTFLALHKKNPQFALAFLGLFISLQTSFFTILTAFIFFVFVGLAL